MIKNGRSLLCSKSSNRNRRNSSSSISSNNQATTININCTGCSANRNTDTNANNKPKDKAKHKKEGTTESVLLNDSNKNTSNLNSSAKNLHRSNSTNTPLVNNTTNNCNKAKKAKYSTQFSIRFHPFSFKLPASSETALSPNRRSFVKNQQMSQRCCLSVSVVPSDKHKHGGKHKSSKKNNVSL